MSALNLLGGGGGECSEPSRGGGGECSEPSRGGGGGGGGGECSGALTHLGWGGECSEPSRGWGVSALNLLGRGGG